MVPDEPTESGNGGAAHLGPNVAAAGYVDSVEQASFQVIGDGGSGVRLAWEATCVRSTVASL